MPTQNHNLPTVTYESRKLVQLHLTDWKISSLYRRALKLSLDWAVQRNLWRSQATYIRSLFDANKDVRDPRQRRVFMITGLREILLTAILDTVPRD